MLEKKNKIKYQSKKNHKMLSPPEHMTSDFEKPVENRHPLEKGQVESIDDDISRFVDIEQC